MNESDFGPSIQALFASRGWPREMWPHGMLKDWQAFIEECVRGYSDNIYEYWNDIRVREWIELVLSVPELQSMVGYKEFAAAVFVLDKQFKNLLIPGVIVPGRKFWWEAGVLKSAGAELAKDFRIEYDIQITIANS